MMPPLSKAIVNCSVYLCTVMFIHMLPVVHMNL